MAFAISSFPVPDSPVINTEAFDWDTDPIAMLETTCEQSYDDGTYEIFNVHDVLDERTNPTWPTTWWPGTTGSAGGGVRPAISSISKPGRVVKGSSDLTLCFVYAILFL